ncbi:MAG: hypothetical protein PWQ23_1776 [Thermoanaerobacter sp.]|nr:hypothetical protein [Thermoanaerobacter sp.]
MSEHIHIITSFIKAWESKQLDKMKTLLAEDAVILHPYFQDSYDTKIDTIGKLEILNNDFNGQSEIEECNLISENSSEQTKTYRTKILDQATDKHKQALWMMMVMDITISLNKIKEISVLGAEIKKNPQKELRTYKKREIEHCSVNDLIYLLAEFWGNNDRDGLYSLFSENAKITHPLYINSLSPDVFIEVMNPTVRIKTEVQKILPKEKNKVIAYINEIPLDKSQKHIGQMILSVYVEENRIKELSILGYNEG